MEKYYSVERNVQMLLYLMKQHEVKKVVVSPGATNVCLVGSLQSDPYFELYSSPDERAAAYLACGMAAESGEPVALSCTGATASRNYIPALTEAFYRKLPILAITSTQHTGRIGHNVAQVIDRSQPLNDIVKLSVQIPIIHDAEDEWAYGASLNNALLELRRNAGGPVHINLTTTYDNDFSVKELPPVKVIRRVGYNDEMPVINAKRVGIFVGAHKRWSNELTMAIDSFCEKYNAVVYCDHTSNYAGKYGVYLSLINGQENYESPCRKVDLLIYIGDVSGHYINLSAGATWRVNPDGMIRDLHKSLTYVFEMEEVSFFKKYTESFVSKGVYGEFYKLARAEYDNIHSKLPEIPFSNAWIASVTIGKLPKYSVLHLGILNTLRTWDYFEKDTTIEGYSNTGGFGIDGCVSSLMGASIVSPDKLFFGVVGDLAFFYDMNVLGNRHIGNNVRLMVINNGRGTEFRNYMHKCARFEENADPYMAAAGHYGNQSSLLLKHYAEDLGYEYMSASNKEEYLALVDKFVANKKYDKSVVFEVFTDSKEESDAIYALNHISRDTKSTAKNAIKGAIGEKGVKLIKGFLRK